MFDGQLKTYLDIRQYVEAMMGPFDEATDVAFLVHMGNALQTIWADIRKDPYYYATWTATKVGDGYPLPPELGLLCSAVGTFDGVGDAPDRTVTYDLHRVGCTNSRGCHPSLGADHQPAYLGASALIIEGGAEDFPDSVKFEGYRVPGPPFFTVEDDCRFWEDIDLPGGFHNVFAKATAGMMFYLGGDSGRGAEYLNLANAEFTQLKVAWRNNHGSPEELGIYKLGSRRLFGPRRCCNLADNWRLSL